MGATAWYPDEKSYGKIPSQAPYLNPDNRHYVKYIPVGYVKSHSILFGYLLWIIGFTGAHRFYYGRPLTGALWFFTAGLLGIGWLIDVFLIPGMNEDASMRFRPGSCDYSVAWILLIFLGVLGIHRFYQLKIFTGIFYLLTGGLFGIGYVYDILTLNEQINESHYHEQATYAY